MSDLQYGLTYLNLTRFSNISGKECEAVELFLLLRYIHTYTHTHTATLKVKENWVKTLRFLCFETESRQVKNTRKLILYIHSVYLGSLSLLGHKFYPRFVRARSEPHRSGEDYITSSFILCTPYQISFG
jgi:hypothetical protein